MSTPIRQAVIPCAGFGTRLLPATKCVPKELFPILNKPAIQYVVEELLAAGISHFIFVENPTKPSVAKHFTRDDGLESFLNKTGKLDSLKDLLDIADRATFEVVIQPEPHGLGNAILCAKPLIHDKEFVVALPDVVFSSTAHSTRQLLQACREQSRSGLTLMRVPRDQSKLYGMVWGRETDHLFWIEGAIEKPTQEESPSELGIVGRYVFSKTIFNSLANAQQDRTGEIELTKVLNQLAHHTPLVGVVENQPIFDVGTIQGIVEATAYFRHQLIQ